MGSFLNIAQTILTTAVGGIVVLGIATTFWRHRRFLGSSLAAALGLLLLAGSLAGPMLGKPFDDRSAPFDSRPWGAFLGGTVLLAGALAYRSAKTRRLGATSHLALRGGFETGCLLTMGAIILSQPDLATVIAQDALINVGLPLYALAAYAIITLWPRRAMSEPPS